MQTSRTTTTPKVLFNQAEVRVIDIDSHAKASIICSSSGQTYRLVERIKKSIYGAVYRGVVVNWNAKSTSWFDSPIEVAIKVCNRAKIELYATEMNYQEDPLTEIQLLHHMSQNPHSNIVHQYECCCDQDHIFSVLEYLPHIELFDYVAKKGRLEESEARYIFHQLVETLEYLHEKHHIVHRDLSLENILYNPQTKQIKLIDFGLAAKYPSTSSSPSNASSSLLLPNIYSGKINYLSPDIYAGIALVDNYAGDRWSAGICILYMLLGFPPITRPSEEDGRYVYLVTGRLIELLQYWQLHNLLAVETIDFIQHILQVNPNKRISLQQMQQHSYLRAFYRTNINSFETNHFESQQLQKQEQHQQQQAYYIPSIVVSPGYSNNLSQLSFQRIESHSDVSTCEDEEEFTFGF
jgi:serine/threonine protein kinase